MKVFSRGFCRLCGVQVDSASKDVLSVPCHEACADELEQQLWAVQQDMAARASLRTGGDQEHTQMVRMPADAALHETIHDLSRLYRMNKERVKCLEAQVERLESISRLFHDHIEGTEKRIEGLEGSATTHDEPKRPSGRSNYHPIMDASRERQRRFLQEVHDVCMKHLDCEVEGWSGRDLAFLLLTRMTDTANPPGTAEERSQAAARMGLSEDDMDEAKEMAEARYLRYRKEEDAADESPSEDVEALAEAAYTAQAEALFQEFPSQRRQHVPWIGLKEGAKHMHRAGVRAVLGRLAAQEKQQEKG